MELSLPVDPELSAEPLLRAAIQHFGSKIALSCSFGGAGGMVLLDMAVRINPRIDVFVLDTDFLFPETYQLIGRIESRYAINVRRVRSELTPSQQASAHGQELWKRQPDRCCDLRKVQPMRNAVRGLDAWITAIRRTQSQTRSHTPKLSWDEEFKLWKLCPIADWTEAQVSDYIAEHDVPMNPLLFDGYRSIGCTHCTIKPTDGDERSGRWAGFAKTECGLHNRPTKISIGATKS